MTYEQKVGDEYENYYCFIYKSGIFKGIYSLFTYNYFSVLFNDLFR